MVSDVTSWKHVTKYGILQNTISFSTYPHNPILCKPWNKIEVKNKISKKSPDGFYWKKCTIDLYHHVENLTKQINTFRELKNPILTPFLKNQIFSRHAVFAKISALLTSIYMQKIRKNKNKTGFFQFYTHTWSPFLTEKQQNLM